VIRLAPPLVVTRAQIDAFLAALPAILSSTRVQAMQASAVASPA
jgi:acetylornithine aminotransferase